MLLGWRFVWQVPVEGLSLVRIVVPNWSSSLLMALRRCLLRMGLLWMKWDMGINKVMSRMSW